MSFLFKRAGVGTGIEQIEASLIHWFETGKECAEFSLK